MAAITQVGLGGTQRAYGVFAPKSLSITFPTTYLWTQESGPGPSNIVSPTSLVTVVNGFQVSGLYVFRLTVTRGDLTDSELFTVAVQDCVGEPCEGYPLPLVHQYFDQLGEPGHDYELETLLTGTLVPLATYHDEACTVPNPNPLNLDAAARDTVFVRDGVRYDLSMTDRAGAVIWERADWSWTAINSSENEIPAVPAGVILLHASATVPDGWLLCDGQAVSRSGYADLFNVIGTTFGSGNGATTFNVPDFQQRFPMGPALTGVGSVLGQQAGAIDHVHAGPSHTHPVAGHLHTQTHTHSIPRDRWEADFVVTPVAGRLGVDDGSGINVMQAAHDHVSGAASAGDTGSAAPLLSAASGTSNTGAANPAFLALPFYIKT